MEHGLSGDFLDHRPNHIAILRQDKVPVAEEAGFETLKA